MKLGALQSLQEFIDSPFGNTVPVKLRDDLEKKYRDFLTKNGRMMKAKESCIIGNIYYINIIVPSESNKGNDHYNVIFQFIPFDKDDEKESTVYNYQVKFFSNSPSFMYQYAYLYKRAGILIDDNNTGNKVDKEYIFTPPTKSNINMNLYYDKSIFYALKFILSHTDYLIKDSWLRRMNVNIKKFSNNVLDFSTIKENITPEKKTDVKEELKKDIKVDGHHVHVNLHNSKVPIIKKIQKTVASAKKGGSIKRISKNSPKKSTFKK